MSLSNTKLPEHYSLPAMSEHPNHSGTTTDTESHAEKDLSSGEVEYPEGGARGWAVAIGAATILFSTFGYANAFG